MLFPKTAKNIFCLFDLCLSSSNETKNYLTKLNAKNIFFSEILNSLMARWMMQLASL